MGKKKKQKKKKKENAILLTPQEEEIIASIIEDIENLTPENINEKIPGPEVAQAVVERITVQSSKDRDLILAIGEAFDHKYVKKAVKKAIFRMKQKGIHVEEPKTHEEPILTLKNIQREEPSAFLGPIDGMGGRGVLVIIPQVPKGVEVGLGVVNHEKGIEYFISNLYSKKQTQDIKALFFEQAQRPIETTISHAVTVLEKAYIKGQSSSGQAAEGYLKMRPWLLDNTQLLTEAPIYDMINVEDIKGEALTESISVKLLEHELMETWIIDPDRIKPLMEEILQAENSPILITEEQKMDRIKELKEKAIQDIFSEEKRIEYKEMLEEMAFLFFKLEQEDYARLALRAALSLEVKETVLMPNIFLRSLLERTLSFFEDMDMDDEDSRDQADQFRSNIII